MAKWRKKPIIVEAEVYHKGMEDGWERCSSLTCGEYRRFDWECKNCPVHASKPYINTLEGKMFISKGDYIIVGVQGERYPCKADIFLATYEAVDETHPVLRGEEARKFLEIENRRENRRRIPHEAYSKKG